MADRKITPNPFIERILSLELVRVTERAAVSAARLRGRATRKPPTRPTWLHAPRTQQLQITAPSSSSRASATEAPCSSSGAGLGNEATGPSLKV